MVTLAADGAPPKPPHPTMPPYTKRKTCQPRNLANFHRKRPQMSKERIRQNPGTKPNVERPLQHAPTTTEAPPETDSDLSPHTVPQTTSTAQYTSHPNHSIDTHLGIEGNEARNGLDHGITGQLPRNSLTPHKTSHTTHAQLTTNIKKDQYDKKQQSQMICGSSSQGLILSNTTTPTYPLTGTHTTTEIQQEKNQKKYIIFIPPNDTQNQSHQH